MWASGVRSGQAAGAERRLMRTLGSAVACADESFSPEATVSICPQTSQQRNSSADTQTDGQTDPNVGVRSPGWGACGPASGSEGLYVKL